MYSLELFSGMHTISNYLTSIGFDSWSVDNNPKLHPRVCCDILNFPYSSMPAHFSFIWASPDCRFFSRNSSLKYWAKTIIKYRQYHYSPISPGSSKAIALLLKTIEIIRYYNPLVWFIENPCGRMRHVKELQLFAPFRYSVNYKDFGFSYSKETDLYTNIYLPIQQFKVIRFGTGVSSINSRQLRSVVPPDLLSYLFAQIHIHYPAFYETIF